MDLAPRDLRTTLEGRAVTIRRSARSDSDSRSPMEKNRGGRKAGTVIRYWKRHCTDCKDFYRPTSSNQKRCSACGLQFNKRFDAKYKIDHRLHRPWQRLAESAKRTAREKNIPYDIDSIYVASIWTDTCPILGLKLERGLNVRKETSPSLDRIVPSLGYVRGNVQVISWRANRIKNDASVEELESIVAHLKRITKG